jgi:hypothetical protein
LEKESRPETATTRPKRPQGRMAALKDGRLWACNSPFIRRDAALPKTHRKHLKRLRTRRETTDLEEASGTVSGDVPLAKAGTKALLRRWCGMKKIAIISASVLALGAASIAADADSMPKLSAAASMAVEASLTPADSAAAAPLRGARLSQHPIERKVRLVAPGIASVNSCDAAYWPYYPSECLKRVETAGV